ncbi:MAG TPA: DNRLRE domain-containing protein [Herpetosiphonaceae bacterium]
MAFNYKSDHAWYKQRLLLAGLLLLTIVVAAVSPVLYASLSASAQTAGPIAVPAIADTSVSAEFPDQNFGLERSLANDANPEEQSFLRFAVEGIPGPIASATLRLYVLNPSPAASGTVWSMTNTTWDESGVTYTNRPAIDGAPVGGFDHAADDSWVEVNVTSIVAGPGVYSFGISQTGDDGVNFASRDHNNAGRRPHLLITTTEAAVPTVVPTLPPAPSPSAAPTQQPTAAPTQQPTAVPSPSAAPTQQPTAVPSPSAAPTQQPTAAPTQQPTAAPTQAPPKVPAAAVAFPGAEGHGSATPGGRGGRIIYVTTLADSGPGSLRSALEASGPRMVLFRVAGTIELSNDISITQPFVTIAGQSAPGEGVQIKGAMLKIRTHDVVLRHLKVRPGDKLNQSSNNERDAVSMSGTGGDEVYNVVIDHSSLVWGPDIGGAAILTNAHDITIQHSILGEGLYLSNHSEGTTDQNGHSLGLNITQLDLSAHPKRITLHHNLLTTSDQRMPQIMGGELIDVVNNVIYNWGTAAAHGNPRSLNLINNMFIRGPMTRTLLAWKSRTNPENPTPRPGSVFEQGTVTEGFSTVRGDPQSMYSATRFGPYSMRSEQSAQDAYRQIVQGAGATWPVRDSADQRIIANLTQRTGQFLNGAQVVWPTLGSGPLAADADLDGMADTWEQQQFGSTSRGSSSSTSGDFDQDGYTDVEEYLNRTDPRTP